MKNIINIIKEKLFLKDLDSLEYISADLDSYNEIANYKIERIDSSMSGNIKIQNTNPCDITNNLNQAILKVSKHLITQPDMLAQIQPYINLGHLDNTEVIDVTFNYNTTIPNPCGGDDLVGEALLKAVVIVSTVNYSILLANNTSIPSIYDGVEGAITAYSVYNIIPFEQSDRPTNVNSVFEITNFEQLPDNPALDYYMFAIDAKVDLIGE